MNKVIKINCTGSHFLDIDLMKNFQGELKKLTDENRIKLKNSIIENGFTAPVFIWKKDNKNFILDGHQRIKALESLKTDGYTIPELPICYITAKTKKEAKKLLLHISSQFGEFDVDVLTDFVSDIYTDIAETIRLVDGELSFNSDEDIIDDKDIELKEEFELVMIFESEEEVEKAYEKFKGVYKCKVLIS